MGLKWLKLSRSGRTKCFKAMLLSHVLVKVKCLRCLRNLRWKCLKCSKILNAEVVAWFYLKILSFCCQFASSSFVRIASLGISTLLYNAWPHPRRQRCTAWPGSAPSCALSDARLSFDAGVHSSWEPGASSTCYRQVGS